MSKKNKTNCETQRPASIGWVALSSVVVVWSVVPHRWHLLSSPLYGVSEHTNHIISVRIWSWQHVSVIAELSQVYCCLVFHLILISFHCTRASWSSFEFELMQVAPTGGHFGNYCNPSHSNQASLSSFGVFSHFIAKNILIPLLIDCHQGQKAKDWTKQGWFIFDQNYFPIVFAQE